MTKTVRWLLLSAMALVTFGLGLVRSEYILNVVDWQQPLLLSRHQFVATNYPMQWHDFFHSLLNDPRWISSFIYLSYPAVATCLAVQLLFKNKFFLMLTLSFYGLGLFLMLLLIGYSVLADDYYHGYDMAQFLKRIYQEPYMSLLLLGGFYWEEKNRASHSQGGKFGQR